MSEVKRFRADHRHVVETEFDDAQFVRVADYDASQSELARLEDEFDTLEHTNIYLKLKNAKLTGLLHMAKELLSTISLHSTMAPADWCESFKREVADRIEKLKSATQQNEDDQ